MELLKNAAQTVCHQKRPRALEVERKLTKVQNLVNHGVFSELNQKLHLQASDSSIFLFKKEVQV